MSGEERYDEFLRRIERELVALLKGARARYEEDKAIGEAKRRRAIREEEEPVENITDRLIAQVAHFLSYFISSGEDPAAHEAALRSFEGMLESIKDARFFLEVHSPDDDE